MGIGNALDIVFPSRPSANFTSTDHCKEENQVLLLIERAPGMQLDSVWTQRIRMNGELKPNILISMGQAFKHNVLSVVDIRPYFSIYINGWLYGM